MPCMTPIYSFLYGKSHINDSKKLGTMMPWMTHIISFEYNKSHINDSKKARYHDAVHNTCYFIFLYGKSHINGPKKLSTMMLWMTRVISFLYGKYHKNGPKRSVPWGCKSHVWQYFTTDMPAYVCTQKKVQYHNAVNDKHCTTETIKKSSVPWCLAWHIWFHFCVENHTQMAQKSSVPWCRAWHMFINSCMENLT